MVINGYKWIHTRTIFCQIRFPVDWLSWLYTLDMENSRSMTMPVTQVLLDINVVKVIYVG